MAAEHLADDAKTVDQRSPERTKRTYSRHELSASRTKVRLRGLGALDRRTASARAVVAFRTDLERDMGGEDALSIQERALVDMAARAWALLGHVDVYLFERESLVDKRRKQLLPVLKERQALADHLSRLLGQLGLQRRAKEAAHICFSYERSFAAKFSRTASTYLSIPRDKRRLICPSQKTSF